MKSNEIRIGNLCLKQEEIYSITALDILNIEECEDRNSFHGFIPIVIEKEWINKFKFTFNEKNNEWWKASLIGSRIIKIYFETGVNQFAFTINAMQFKEIKYIHQLQNLYFALTGEELTIK